MENITNAQMAKGLIAEIVKREEELAALKVALRLFTQSGDAAEVSPSGQVSIFQRTPRPPRSQPQSISSLARQVLLEAGKPLSGVEIVAALAAKGKIATRDVILGAIYRDIKKGKRFRKMGPGIFGLLEWSDTLRHGRAIQSLPPSDEEMAMEGR